MQFDVYYVFYSLNPHKHVSASITVIFRVISEVMATHLTTFVRLYSCNNDITLNMAALVTKTCL